MRERCRYYRLALNLIYIYIWNPKCMFFESLWYHPMDENKALVLFWCWYYPSEYIQAWLSKIILIVTWVYHWQLQIQHVALQSSMVAVIQWSWWRHPMETFFALLAICAGNSPVTAAFLIKMCSVQIFQHRGLVVKGLTKMINSCSQIKLDNYSLQTWKIVSHYKEYIQVPQQFNTF